MVEIQKFLWDAQDKGIPVTDCLCHALGQEIDPEVGVASTDALKEALVNVANKLKQLATEAVESENFNSFDDLEFSQRACYRLIELL